MPENPFIIRVYALIMNENGEVLISDEFQLGMRMTKFPGGGLEYGEGPLDCLHREAMEEFGQDIEITGHFYTTDYFQQAMFYPEHQLISIYYIARLTTEPHFRISEKTFDFEDKEGSQSFRWVSARDLNPEELTFPVDKKVAEMLRKQYRSFPE